MHRLLRTAACLALPAALAAQTPVVTFAGENMRLASASVTAAGGVRTFNVGLVMQDDNANAALSDSFRRWWHCRIDNLPALGATLVVTVSNAGYSDVILPVWAQSTNGGASYGAWARMPTSATPTVSGGDTHRFTLVTPASVNSIKIAKWFPYTVTDKNALLARIAGHASGRVRSITSLGNSAQGRPIELVELTDPTVPDAGKKRVWVHTAVHPAESPAYFMAEGLIDFLLSADQDARTLLQRAIVDVVPMANPDGAFLGNYRTTSTSTNLEDEWGAPYTDPTPEIVRLRTKIEQLMGTPASPGSNPIEALLNLHSSHNVANPFHFRHSANASWVPGASGVLPAVNALETAWISALRARSAFVNLGSTQSSTLSPPSRPYVEAMMHDRWSADPAWSASHARVMAITLEGTYRRGPDGVTWNTPTDYRDVGAAIGKALVDWFGFTPLDLTASLAQFGASCNGLLFTGSIAHVAPDLNIANLQVLGANPGAFGLLGLAFADQTLVPLPPPFSCQLLANLATSVPLTLLPGVTPIALTIPLTPGLRADLHCVTVLPSGGNLVMQSSNGIELANDF